MDDRPISHLLKDLMFNFSSLVRSEIKVAATELKISAARMGRSSSKAALYFGIACFGAFALLAFLVIGLGRLLGDNYWLSSLIVGIVLTVPSAFLGFAEIKQLRELDKTLPRARFGLEEDARLLKNKAEEISNPMRAH